jgi:hypothetical protein
VGAQLDVKRRALANVVKAPAIDTLAMSYASRDAAQPYVRALE